MNESQLDPAEQRRVRNSRRTMGDLDRTSPPAPRRTKTPAIWWTLAALYGVFAAFYAKLFFTTQAGVYGLKAVLFGLVAAVMVWYLLRPPTPALLRKISPVLKWTSLVIFGLLATLSANEFFATGERWITAVVFGLMTAAVLWDLFRSSRVQQKK